MPLVDTQSPSAWEGRATAIRTDSTHPAPIQLRHILRFQYDLPKVGRSTHGAITVAHYLFHQIEDMDVFYAAMGYDKRARDSGFGGEEFIWDRYTRDGAKFIKQCLQVQIAAYLHQHSAKFNVLYGPTYGAVTGECDLNNRDETDNSCASCPMHPRLAV